MHPAFALSLFFVYLYVAQQWLPLLLVLAGAPILAYMLCAHVFTSGAPAMSTRRKLMMASWSPPSEGTVFGVLNINAEPIMAYLEKLNSSKQGPSVSVTTAVLKAVALAMREAPGLNSRIAFGAFLPRPSIDVSALVNLEDGADLAIAKVMQADHKSLKDISQELRTKADKLRKKQDKDFEANKGIMRLLPVWLLQPMVGFVGYLSGALGLDIPALGVRPFPFGSVMVSSVGMLGVESAFVPFTPFARVPFLLAVGEVQKRAVVGENDEIKVQRGMTITGTIDHRFADGADVAKLARKLKLVLENPNMMEEEGNNQADSKSASKEKK